MDTLYNLKNIYALLINGFTESELRRFCFTAPEFQKLYKNLPKDISVSEIADQILDYAERTMTFDALLIWAKLDNPAKYKRHAPYHSSLIGVSTPSVIVTPISDQEQNKEQRDAIFTDKTALIVTFSGKAQSSTLLALQTLLCSPQSDLKLKLDTPGVYHSSNQLHNLIEFNIPGVKDSSLLQLKLQTTEPAPLGWHILWTTFQSALNTLAQESDLSFQNPDLWGWTVAFCATYTANVDDKAFIAQVPGFLEESYLNFYRASVPGGYLRLVEAFTSQSFPLTYIATCTLENYNQLMHFLFDPLSPYPFLNLMLQKCYYQHNRYFAERDKFIAPIHNLQQAIQTVAMGHMKIPRKLGDLYISLKTNAVMLHQISGTILVNHNNYQQKIASDHTLIKTENLWQQHTYRIGRTLTQVNHDRDYLQAPLDAAEAALNVLQVRATNRNGLLLWLLVTILSINQIIPIAWGFGQRIATLIISMLVVFILWLVWYR